MNSFRKILIMGFLGIAASWATLPSGYAQVTAFFFEGNPGFVADGTTETFVPSSTITISASLSDYNGVSVQAANTSPLLPDYEADFTSSNDTELNIGLYTNATRYPFNYNSDDPPSTDTNGLDFSGDGRGDNTLTGEFDVLEVNYSSSGTVLSFAADFIQNDGDGFNSDYGSVRYNSNIPLDIPSSFPTSLPVPEPSVWVLLLGGLGTLFALHRRLELSPT